MDQRRRPPAVFAFIALPPSFLSLSCGCCCCLRRVLSKMLVSQNGIYYNVIHLTACPGFKLRLLIIHPQLTAALNQMQRPVPSPFVALDCYGIVIAYCRGDRDAPVMMNSATAAGRG